MKPRDRADFTIAIICALPLEGDAVEVIFDEIYDEVEQGYGKQPGDTNAYVTGRIGQHNVVLCYMPSMGRSSAASVASSLRLSYMGVKLALVVGICGGVPYPSGNQQIFLGDVIISDSVIQYDFGKQYPGGFKRNIGVKDTLGRPSQEIRSLLASLKTRRARLKLEKGIAEYLCAFRETELGWHLPTSEDTLFDSSFAHKHRFEEPSFDCACFTEGRPDEICPEASEMSCDRLACDDRHVIRRRSTTEGTGSSVHIGTIASADTVMKSGEDRDRTVRSERVLGFEMEGAGVWDNIPCIVIKGVCDYADSHKSKDWQDYAAAVGACAAKSFLSMWTRTLGEGLPGDPKIPRIPFFIGRSNELDEIRSKLFGASTFDQTVVVQGLAGIGKSQLVAKYANSSLSNYSAIFWLNASSPLHLASSFSEARERIDNKGHYAGPAERIQDGLLSLNQLYQRYRKKEQSTGAWKACAASGDVDAVKRWLNRKRNNNWLLVFDNYQSSTSSNNDEEGPLIERFFPEDRQGHVIITTQSSLSCGHTIRLGKIKSQHEALDIFCKATGREELRKDAEASKLVDQMDGLPLALVAAGSYMSNINIDCRQYLKLHNESWHTLQKHTPRVPSYNGNLCSCWAITFHELSKSLDVFRVLVCWACLESQDVWFELLDPNGLIWPGILVMKFDSAMRLLFDYGIVEFGSHAGDDSIGSRGYNMQRSFHAWLQTRIRNSMHDASIESLALSAVIHCSQKLIKSGIYHKGLLRVLPHASRCADLAMTERIHADVNKLIHLATVFQYAGYGKSRSFSLYLAMLQLENPAKVHFMTSEMLFQHALRKIEQASALGTTTEAAGRIPNQRFIYHNKVAALCGLRIVYKHMCEFSRRRMITSQIYAVHRDADNKPEAQLEQANMSSESSHAKDRRILRRLAFTHGLLTILTTVQCIMFLEDGMDLLQLLAVGYTFMGSWWTFMYIRRHRRKALVVLILSSVPLGYLVRNLGLGPFMLLSTEYPFVLMVLSTFPVLYYQGLSTVAH